MHHRTTKVALVAILIVAFVLMLSGSAFAAGGPWPDLTPSILGDYGIALEEVAAISDGYPDDTWRPYNNVTRQQFVKMAVDAYRIPLAFPDTPTYSDVPSSSYYYGYIEGATAAGLTNGVGDGKFDPMGIVTREQAAAIISRWVSGQNGYDLDTMYTQAEIDAILGSFPDGDLVGPSLQAEMAFAVDFGIVWGTNTGMLAPKATMTRIQGAAMLIRSWSIIPEVMPPLPPANIELVSDDEAENLIGLTHQYTYEVTDENGDPVEGALVDFDTLMAQWYVGNVQPAAGLTDADGMVTVNLISTEPGIQRISAAAPGLLAMWSTKYWLALDEVYVLAEDPRESRNNAGTSHTWEARVVVFGPGPLSTSVSDWYNTYDPEADPTDVEAGDAEDLLGDDASYEDELALPAPLVPRSLPGIPVYWELDGVGEITAAEFDAEAIADDGLSVWAYTDADGLTSVEIYSEEAGDGYVTVMADYVGNPYEGQLFDHDTFNYDDWDHYFDWDDQPAFYADATKTWIPHVIGGDEGPIDPAYTYANIGEEFELTITLEDVYGNPVADKQVEWFMQGIGHFITDDDLSTTDPTNADGNHDIDQTDEMGQATVMVKSLDPGEQIVHAKVRDKGIDGMEGQFMTYDAEVQWFDVDVVTFDDPTTDDVGEWVEETGSDLPDNDQGGWDAPDNEALATNDVGTSHDFTLHVYGLKLEYDPWWELNNFPWNQTPIIDTDAAGHAYDEIFDWRDAEYLGGILLVNEHRKYNGDSIKLAANGGYAHDANGNGVIDPDEKGTVEWGSMGKMITLSLEGGYTRFDWDMDGYKEPFEGVTGIYLPLEDKDVTFDMVDNYIGYMFDENGIVESVGSFSPETAVTDENGEAVVTVTSNEKGPQTVVATVDWEGNPHNMSELLQAYAKKIWVASGWDKIVVTIDGEEVANSVDGEVLDAPANPVWVDPAVDENVDPMAVDPVTGMALNYANIEVHVYDAFGNDLPDYEVVYLLENVGTYLPGPSQGADRTYLPLAFFRDADTQNVVPGDPNDVNGEGFDMNGPRPDHDEPVPDDDPYAEIIGENNTPAFFFNQWLGAGYDEDSITWNKNVFQGMGFYINTATGFTEPGYAQLPGQAFGPFFDNYGIHGVGLLTDGAKAWTMDGYFRPDWDIEENGDVFPNALTGSNVDVQLAEDPTLSMAGHYKSIVKIMVYAPADGLVVGQSPIWHYQVHKVWDVPRVTSVTLEPAADAAIAGLESQTVTATVRDQNGSPIEGVEVYFNSTRLEGDAAMALLTDDGPYLTNAEGKANLTWTQAAGIWGVERVQATAAGVNSNYSYIQWIYQDDTGALGNLVDAINGSTKVTAYAGTTPWNNLVLSAFEAYGSPALGSGTYNVLTDLAISTPTKVWSPGDRYFVGALGSTNTDEKPNWVTDLVLVIN